MVQKGDRNGAWGLAQKCFTTTPTYPSGCKAFFALNMIAAVGGGLETTLVAFFVKMVG
jgi:hypothetical protein